MSSPSSATAGTVGGTLLALLLQINAVNLAETAILAAVGAAVSFATSLLMKLAVKHMRNRDSR